MQRDPNSSPCSVIRKTALSWPARRRWAGGLMRRSHLCIGLFALLLVGSLAIADEWFDLDDESYEVELHDYADPWDTDYEADPWSFGAEDSDEDRPDRFRLYDDVGRRTGRVERNPILEDTYSVYDERGRRTGRVERNPILDDDYSVYDDRGRRVREIRRNPAMDDQYDIYDQRGVRIGRIHENPLIDGHYDVYDQRGRRIGRVESD